MVLGIKKLRLQKAEISFSKQDTNYSSIYIIKQPLRIFTNELRVLEKWATFSGEQDSHAGHFF